MTQIFDHFSHLDPTRAQKQIEADLGHPIFDQFSLLDPGRFEQQIEFDLDQKIFTNFSKGDFDLELSQYFLRPQGGGGGGIPSNALTLNGEALTLNGEILTLGA